MSFFSNPEDALAAFAENPAEIVVSDLQMPEIDGLEMVSQMQDMADCANSRFIILSGSGDFSQALSAINELGVFRFLQKPIDRDALIEGIEEGISEIQLVESGANSQHAESALGMINAAIIVLSRNSEILFSNPAGQTMIREKGGLNQGVDGLCRASNSDDTRELKEMIESACDDQEDRVRWLALKEDAYGVAHNIVAIPQGEMGTDRSVVLLSTYAQSESEISVEVLQGMFGLTPSEAAITYAITMGENLEEAAKTSGITVSSARTYLKRVFGKTGANRQADLVKMILTSPAALVKKQA